MYILVVGLRVKSRIGVYLDLKQNDYNYAPVVAVHALSIETKAFVIMLVYV
jgi:hypothetical protein